MGIEIPDFKKFSSHLLVCPASRFCKKLVKMDLLRTNSSRMGKAGAASATSAEKLLPVIINAIK
jgi:hypothetical protein